MQPFFQPFYAIFYLGGYSSPSRVVVPRIQPNELVLTTSLGEWWSHYCEAWSSSAARTDSTWVKSCTRSLKIQQPLPDSLWACFSLAATFIFLQPPAGTASCRRSWRRWRALSRQSVWLLSEQERLDAMTACSFFTPRWVRSCCTRGPP